MTTPTPEQLAAAGLIEMTPVLNGKPFRSYDSVNKNWPPIPVAYISASAVRKCIVTFTNTQGQSYPSFTLSIGATFILPPAPTSAPPGEKFTFWADGLHAYAPGATYIVHTNVAMIACFAAAPVPTPVPSSSYPMGIAPTPLAAGESELFFCDFTGPLNTNDIGVYTGTSQPSSGQFGGSHTTVVGGELDLKMDQDTTLGIAVNNFEVGAGVQLVSHTLWAGQRLEWVGASKSIAGAFKIGLLFPPGPNGKWPSNGEVDIWEQDGTDAYRSTVIWADANGGKQQVQSDPINSNDNPHKWAVEWTVTGEFIFYLDGAEYWSTSVPALPFGAVGLNACFQTQQEFVFNNPGQVGDELIDWVRIVKLA